MSMQYLFLGEVPDDLLNLEDWYDHPERENAAHVSMTAATSS